MEGPRFGCGVVAPLRFRSLRSGARYSSQVKTLVSKNDLWNQNRLMVTTPCSELDHDQRGVLRQSAKRKAVAPLRRFRDQDCNMGLVWVALPVSRPIIEDAKTVTCIRLAEL